MPSKGQRKQILLFLLAVLLPAAVFCFFTIRMIYQERELQQKRASDERGLVAAMIGARLAERLTAAERLAASRLGADPDDFRAMGASSPPLLLIGKWEAGSLVFPWDIGAGSAEKQMLLVTGTFGKLVREAEDAEFRRGDPAAAAASFRAALASGRTPFEKSYAALNLGRALEKEGRPEEASGVFESLAAAPLDDTDEYGIPFSLWAVERLLRRPNNGRFVSRLVALSGAAQWPSAAAFSRLKDVIASAMPGITDPGLSKALAELDAAVDQRRATIELAAAHRRSFEKTLVESSGPSREAVSSWHWSKEGEQEILFAFNANAERSISYLWAFDAPALLDAVLAEPGVRGSFPGSCRFVTESVSGSVPLGPSFPALRLVFAGADEAAWARSSHPSPWFFVLALGLAFGAAAFGMTLLLRDARRERRLASLQSQFVSSVSHELKTPLTSIRMFAESLALGWTQDPAERQGYLETIVGESDRLGRLLDNVLDFSRIEQGMRRYWPEPISLADVIRRTVRTLSFPLERQGFTLDIRLDPDVPTVMADTDAMEQAILNLLQNAMKYSGESRTIEVVLKKDGSCAAIGVVDHGLGIRDEDKGRIFDKFVRVESPENSRIPGAGLGLTIVRHIAEAHGGRVDVESRPGEGSTFRIRLPLGGKP